ncbi:hypothetical protein BH11BAC4_BH11BAC4_04560 [soil metagenome]
MTLYQFNKLREVEQFDVLLSDGIIVGRRKDYSYEYVLYQLNKIYIELRYYKDHKTMPSIRGFTCSGNSIKPYLEQIDISELLMSI